MQKIPVARSIVATGRNAKLCWRLLPRLRSEFLGLSPTIPVLAKTHMTAKRAYVLAAEEDQNDACEDEINALFECLTTEPAICPTA
jgi:hypothetical protein